MRFKQKYNVDELREYASCHTTNECAKHFDISYQAMAQLLYRYKLKHNTEQVNNYQRNTKLHWIWRAIKQRCTNPANKAYKNYGGRGINMYEGWQGIYGFSNFSRWAMQNDYKEGLTIDRIDNNKGYFPENCRWVTSKEQANNKRTNVRISYKGVTKTLSQWAEELGINYSCLQTRHYKGYTDVEIIEGKKLK